MLGVLPLFHVFAMTTVMNFGISQGCEIILAAALRADRDAEADRQARPTMMPGVPTLFNAMLRHPHIAQFRPELAQVLHLRRRRAAARGEARLRGDLRLQRWSRATA